MPEIHFGPPREPQTSASGGSLNIIVASAPDDWLTYLQVRVRLCVAGRLSVDDLSDMAARNSQAILDDASPAAQRLLGLICTALDEPLESEGNYDNTRRKRLRELTGI